MKQKTGTVITLLLIVGVVLGSAVGQDCLCAAESLERG